MKLEGFALVVCLSLFLIPGLEEGAVGAMILFIVLAIFVLRFFGAVGGVFDAVNDRDRR